MFSHLLAKLTAYLLRHKSLSLSDKTLCVNALISNVHALPIYGIIKIDDSGTLAVNGETLDMEKAIQLREAAKVLLHNQAHKLIQEQVASLAVNLGVHQATSPEQVLFAKAALWVKQEEEKLFHQLAQE